MEKNKVKRDRDQKTKEYNTLNLLSMLINQGQTVDDNQYFKWKTIHNNIMSLKIAHIWTPLKRELS